MVSFRKKYAAVGGGRTAAGGGELRLSLQYQDLFDLSVALSMFVVIAVFLFLFEPRCSRRVYVVSLVLFTALWVGGNLYVLLVYGIDVQGRYIDRKSVV